MNSKIVLFAFIALILFVASATCAGIPENVSKQFILLPPFVYLVKNCEFRHFIGIMDKCGGSGTIIKRV